MNQLGPVRGRQREIRQRNVVENRPYQIFDGIKYYYGQQFAGRNRHEEAAVLHPFLFVKCKMWEDMNVEPISDNGCIQIHKLEGQQQEDSDEGDTFDEEVIEVHQLGIQENPVQPLAPYTVKPSPDENDVVIEQQIVAEEEGQTEQVEEENLWDHMLPNQEFLFSRECIICESRPSNVAYRPCRHLNLCCICNLNLQNKAQKNGMNYCCVSCKTPIDKVYRFHYERIN